MTLSMIKKKDLRYYSFNTLAVLSFIALVWINQPSAIASVKLETSFVITNYESCVVDIMSDDTEVIGQKEITFKNSTNRVTLKSGRYTFESTSEKIHETTCMYM